MTSNIEAQRIEESLELQEIDTDLFKSIKLWKFASGSGAFGGNIIAQAAHAATKTVPIEFHLHSLHCYFISFGDVSIPTGIIYLVDRLRDGKSYITRSVKANQRSKCIFSLLISFHKPELNQNQFKLNQNLNNLNNININQIIKPENCNSIEIELENYLNKNKIFLNKKMLDYLERNIQENKFNSIEHRQIKLSEREKDQDKINNFDTCQMYWFRSRAKIRSDPAYQKLVLAYASDFRFIGTVSNAIGLNLPGSKKTSMLASLDHSMFFYDNDFDVSEWMLYKMDAETAKDGRGLVIGRIYARDGRLLAVCTQEGVIRVTDESKKPLIKL